MKLLLILIIICLCYAKTGKYVTFYNSVDCSKGNVNFTVDTCTSRSIGFNRLVYYSESDYYAPLQFSGRSIMLATMPSPSKIGSVFFGVVYPDLNCLNEDSVGFFMFAPNVIVLSGRCYPFNDNITLHVDRSIYKSFRISYSN